MSLNLYPRSYKPRYLLLPVILFAGCVMLLSGLPVKNLFSPALAREQGVQTISPMNRRSGLLALLLPPPPPMAWNFTGTLAEARAEFTTTLLQNGRVLVVGGIDSNASPLSRAEIYDPGTKTWDSAASMNTERAAHTATLLPDGKVLVTGGYNNSAAALTDAEIYDPANNTWTPITDSMAKPRSYHTATLLPNGKVLVAGGFEVEAADSSELYDPAAGDWGGTAPIPSSHAIHTASSLQNGNVLVAGGYDINGNITNNSAVYDPATNSWMATLPMNAFRVFHAATTMQNGVVLVSGGEDENGIILNSSEVFDPVLGTWAPVSSMSASRSIHTSTLLPDGNVLVTGGYNNDGNLNSSTEVYNPSDNSWSDADDLNIARYYHSATLLLDGTVLVVSGYDGDFLWTPTAELFAPSNNTPIAVCKNIEVPVNDSCTVSITADAVDGGSSDPDGDGLMLSLDNGGPFGVGVHTVQLTVKDAQDASNSCSATVTVVDNTLPQITAPGDAAYSCAGQVPAANVADATASDNCGMPSVEVTQSSNGGAGSPASPLIITRTFKATDASGKTASDNQVITVIDSTPPLVTAPVDASYSCVGQVPAANPSAATASDNCGTTPSISVSDTNNGGAGSSASPLIITRKFTATDAAGNSASDNQIITVSDNTPPTVTAPNDLSFQTGPNATTCGLFVSNAALGSATKGDNCAGSVTVTRSGVPAGNVFPVGTTTITYTATDAKGNKATDTQTVTITDNTAPKITAPANKTVSTSAGSCSAILNPGTPAVSDNCSTLTVKGVRSDNQALNAPYPIGTTTILWSAKDAAGNMATAMQTILVKDTVAPSINGLSVDKPTLGDPNHKMVNVTVNYSTADNCAGSVTCQIVSVTSNEPANGTGDGDAAPDWAILDAHHVLLRAERSGNGNGRIYTITVKCTDSRGNSTVKTVQVFVPKL
jgi:N-acetylneuraminic acid mutarotase